jgi:hypothetical protein
MEKDKLRKILSQIADRSLPVDKALGILKNLPFEELGFATIDHHRALRTGYPEVIFCQNKTPQQVVAIATAQVRHESTVFGTRASRAVFDAVSAELAGAQIDEQARCFWIKSSQWKKKRTKKQIVICSAGTADGPVVAEARATIEIMGHTPIVLNDVGVAGIHRLFHHKDTLRSAAAIIAVAGMEGALPSVIGGYVSCPVIGVPTSVGYGSHLNGMVPLFAMLNSCATGLSVVNIDNGFGAACAAVAIIDTK